MRFIQILFILFFVFFNYSCAKRGSPTGGFKDTIPPIMINATPKNKTTFFDSEKITITFNEYLSLKNINEKLIISTTIDTNKYNKDTQYSICKIIKM